MVRFIVFLNFTDQGIRNVFQTVSRADSFAEIVKKAGGTVAQQYWTTGAYDGAMVLEAPDELTASALLAKLGSLGNVRTQSLRAFDRKEIEAIFAKTR